MPEQSINFQVRELSGVEIFKYRAADHPSGIDSTKLVPITQESELAVDELVLIPSLMGGGYHLMKVIRDTYGVLYANEGNFLALLAFGEDERNAWTCTGFVNKRGIEKLEINT